MRMLSDLEERIRNKAAENIVRRHNSRSNPEEPVSEAEAKAEEARAALDGFMFLMLTLKKYPVSSSAQDDSEEETAKYKISHSRARREYVMMF
jgi:hypothetical protein